MRREPDPRVAAVWELAQADLAAQMSAVDELRARVGTLVAAAAIATGFLASQALSAHHRFPAGAWVAIGAAGALIVACVWILKPRAWAGQSTDTATLFENIDVRPDDQIDDFQRQMAGFARKQFEINRTRLQHLYWVFTAALVFLCADFAGWMWVLAHP